MANSNAAKIVGDEALAGRILGSDTINQLKQTLETVVGQSGDQLQKLQSVIANCPNSPVPPAGQGGGQGDGHGKGNGVVPSS